MYKRNQLRKENLDAGVKGTMKNNRKNFVLIQ